MSWTRYETAETHQQYYFFSIDRNSVKALRVLINGICFHRHIRYSEFSLSDIWLQKASKKENKTVFSFLPKTQNCLSNYYFRWEMWANLFSKNLVSVVFLTSTQFHKHHMYSYRCYIKAAKTKTKQQKKRKKIQFNYLPIYVDGYEKHKNYYLFGIFISFNARYVSFAKWFD